MMEQMEEMVELKAAEEAGVDGYEDGLADRVFEDVSSGICDLAVIAQRHDRSIDEINRIMAEHEHVRKMRAMAETINAGVQHLICRLRVNAATKLAQIAMDNGNTELARRASVDLLRMDLARVYDDARRSYFQSDRHHQAALAFRGALMDSAFGKLPATTDRQRAERAAALQSLEEETR